MRVAGLWSGGKDSCFACYRAMALGHELAVLFNFSQPGGGDSLSHGLSAELILKQAGLTGIPVVQQAMSRERYRDEFKALISASKEEWGIRGLVFGDIYLQGHRDWLEGVCRESDVEAIFPLWGRNTAELALEIINCGFEAIVVAVKADLPGREWLGRKIDRKFLEGLAPEIDPCGEKGEFHTLVISGPIFKKGGISVEASGPVLKAGAVNSWFLDIKKIHITPKDGKPDR